MERVAFGPTLTHTIDQNKQIATNQLRNTFSFSNHAETFKPKQRRYEDKKFIDDFEDFPMLHDVEYDSGPDHTQTRDEVRKQHLKRDPEGRFFRFVRWIRRIGFRSN